jgi:hypothetical protein
MRIYSVGFASVNVTAAQDLIMVIAGASKMLELHEASLDCIVSGTSVQNLAVSFKIMPATVTNGSGGSAPTPQSMMSGDAAATFTARANDTTRATTSGTARTFKTGALNTINGYIWLPAPEDRPLISISQALVFGLDGAPSGSITMSGNLIVREIG